MRSIRYRVTMTYHAADCCMGVVCSVLTLLSCLMFSSFLLVVDLIRNCEEFIVLSLKEGECFYGCLDVCVRFVLDLF